MRGGIREGVDETAVFKHLENSANEIYSLFHNIFEFYDWEDKPPKFVVRSILGLCFHLLSNFQREYRNIGSDDDSMNLKTLIGWTNAGNKFVSCHLQFVKSISTKTNVSEDEVNMMISSSLVKREFAEIMNKFLERIQFQIKDLIVKGLKRIHDYRQVDVAHIMDELAHDLTDIFRNLIRSLANKLWKTIWQGFTSAYCLMTIQSSKCYKHKELKSFTEKLERDIMLIKGVFGNLVKGAAFEEQTKKLDSLLELFTISHDEILKPLLNLELFLKEDFDKNILSSIFLLRVDIRKQEKNMIVEMFECRPQGNFLHKPCGGQFYSAIRSTLLAKEFVGRLKSRVATRERVMKEKLANSKVLEIDVHLIGKTDNIIEFETFQKTSGNVDYVLLKLKRKKTAGVTQKTYNEAVFNKTICGKNITFSKRFFWFEDGLLLWTYPSGQEKVKANTGFGHMFEKKKVESNMDGRVSLGGICNIQKHQEVGTINHYIYFNVGQNIYVFVYKNSVEWNKWAAALTRLAYQAKRDVRQVEFEKFSAVEEALKYDELFVADKLDYSYDKIKFLKRREIESQKFDFGNYEHNEEIEKFNRTVVDREDSVLSDSSDDSQFLDQADLDKAQTANTNAQIQAHNAKLANAPAPKKPLPTKTIISPAIAKVSPGKVEPKPTNGNLLGVTGADEQKPKSARTMGEWWDDKKAANAEKRRIRDEERARKKVEKERIKHEKDLERLRIHKEKEAERKANGGKENVWNKMFGFE